MNGYGRLKLFTVLKTDCVHHNLLRLLRLTTRRLVYFGEWLWMPAAKFRLQVYFILMSLLVLSSEDVWVFLVLPQTPLLAAFMPSDIHVYWATTQEMRNPLPMYQTLGIRRLLATYPPYYVPYNQSQFQFFDWNCSWFPGSTIFVGYDLTVPICLSQRFVGETHRCFKGSDHIWIE